MVSECCAAACKSSESAAAASTATRAACSDDVAGDVMGVVCSELTSSAASVFETDAILQQTGSKRDSKSAGTQQVSG